MHKVLDIHFAFDSAVGLGKLFVFGEFFKTCLLFFLPLQLFLGRQIFWHLFLLKALIFLNEDIHNCNFVASPLSFMHFFLLFQTLLNIWVQVYNILKHGINSLSNFNLLLVVNAIMPCLQLKFL